MERFVKGDVIIVNFPFTDATTQKRRPCVVLKQQDNGENVIALPITSSNNRVRFAFEISMADFERGGLPKEISYVQYDKVMTVHKSLINSTSAIGHLNNTVSTIIIGKFIDYIST